MFVAIEGVDASGKATQTKLLVDWLRQHGFPAASSQAFPDYSTPVGMIVRAMLHGVIKIESPLSKAYIFQALLTCDRQAKAVELFDKAERKGLVADRYSLSGYVYGSEEGCDETWLRKTLFNGAIPEPDLWIFLDVPIDEVARRLEIRSKRDNRPLDLNEQNLAKLERVRQRYRKVFTSEDPPISGDYPYRQIIDGTGTIESIHQEIVKTIQRLLLP